MSSVGRQRNIHRQEVTFTKHRLKISEFDVDGPGAARINVGVMGDKMHIKRCADASQLCTDVAKTNRSQCSADQACAHMIRTQGKTFRASTDQRVFGHEFPGQGQDVGQDGCGDRSPDPVGRDTHGNTRCRAGRHVDGVITDAKPRNQGQSAAVGNAVGVEFLEQQHQSIEVFKGFPGHATIHTGHVGKFDIRVASERCQIKHWKYRFTIAGLERP